MQQCFWYRQLHCTLPEAFGYICGDNIPACDPLSPISYLLSAIRYPLRDPGGNLTGYASWCILQHNDFS
jgi:hypothetical protein